MICLAVVAVVLELSAEGLCSTFGLSVSQVPMAAVAVRITMAVLPITAVRLVGINYLQGTGKAAKANTLAFALKMLVILPCILLTVLVATNLFGVSSGIVSIFVGMSLGEFASTCFVLFFVVREARALDCAIDSDSPLAH